MYEIITIPFDRVQKTFNAEVLNRFAINKIVRQSRISFFDDGTDYYWTVFLEYDPILEPAPKKAAAALGEKETALLQRLRQWRKDRADKDGVPVYVVATNRELESVAAESPKTVEALKSIKGWGKGKIEKYGKAVTDLVKAFWEAP